MSDPGQLARLAGGLTMENGGLGPRLVLWRRYGVAGFPGGWGPGSPSLSLGTVGLACVRVYVRVYWVSREDPGERLNDQGLGPGAAAVWVVGAFAGRMRPVEVLGNTDGGTWSYALSERDEDGGACTSLMPSLVF